VVGSPARARSVPVQRNDQEMPIASRRARNALVRMSAPLSPWLWLPGAIGSTALGCSLLLNDAATQCSMDSDCEGLGFHGWRCDTDGVCIAADAAAGALPPANDGEALDATTSDEPETSADIETGADTSGGSVGALDASDADEQASAPSLLDADAGPGLESGVPDANASDGPVGAQDLYCGLRAPLGITLYNGDICWVGDVTPQGLFCAPASGGSSANIRRISEAVDAPFLADVFDLLLDANYIYWSNGKNNQVVRKAKMLGGRPQQYFTGGDRVSFLTFGGATVWGATIWATDFGDLSASGVGEVIVGPSPRGGTASNAIYLGETGASGVAVYGGNVYWGTSDSLNFGPLTGNAHINRIKSPERNVGGVAVDANGTAYFLAGRSLYRYTTGAADATFMYGETSVFGTGDVAVDDHNVYFSEPGRGCIKIIPK